MQDVTDTTRSGTGRTAGGSVIASSRVAASARSTDLSTLHSATNPTRTDSLISPRPGNNVIPARSDTEQNSTSQRLNQGLGPDVPTADSSSLQAIGNRDMSLANSILPISPFASRTTVNSTPAAATNLSMTGVTSLQNNEINASTAPRQAPSHSRRRQRNDDPPNIHLPHLFPARVGPTLRRSINAGLSAPLVIHTSPLMGISTSTEITPRTVVQYSEATAVRELRRRLAMDDQGDGETS